jgi:hypothetical protein
LAPSGHEIIVLTSEDIREEISNQLSHQPNWRCKDSTESVRSYFKHIEQLCKEKIDFLFVVTPYHLSDGRITSAFIDFEPECPSASMAHLLRATFDHDAKFQRTAVRQINRYLIEVTPKRYSDICTRLFFQFALPEIVYNYDALFVEYPPMKPYIQNQTSWERPVYTFPPIVRDTHFSNETSNDGSLHITIPGIVMSYTRDYDMIISLLKNMLPQYCNKLEVEFLGGPGKYNGKQIIKDIKNLSQSDYKITYYEEWLDKGLFDERLREADVVLNPIKVTKPTPVYKRMLGKRHEVRGTTQGSGVIFDAIRHGLPLILPAAFELDSMIKQFTVTYEDESQLQSILTELIRTKRLSKLQRQSRVESMKYSVTNQKNRLMEKIKLII